MRIIPAIDIIDGKCVRLSQGDYASSKVYANDPLEMAHQFEDAGIRYLHLVDLDGARSSKVINWKVLERISNATSLQIDFGGGVKTDEDLRIVLESGATQVTGGSIAVKDPDTFKNWLRQQGGDVIILGADVRDNKIAVSGWEESSDLDLLPFLSSYFNEGIKYCICTDIQKDGMLMGPSADLYTEILTAFPTLNLIASGGVSGVDDLMILKEIGVEGVIVGKAYYEGKITLKQLAEFV